MRSRSPSPEHAEAVSRRLATLSAELAAVRGEPPSEHQHTRLRAGPREVAVVPAEPPPPVPTPGRHAARRLADRMVLGGSRVALGPAHVAVVAVVAAVAVGLAAWLVVRGQAEPVPVSAPTHEAEPLLGSVSPVPSAAETPPSSHGPGDPPHAAGDPVEVTVDVAGKVRRPGIAVLPEGSRVVDALEAAGGALKGVDLTSLNLARPLVDGEQVLVGVRAPAGVAGAVGQPGSPTASPGQLVDLNAADEVALETLPGVGPVTAAAIVAWRTEHGGFTAVDELLEVDGIGEATLAQIAPHVTI